MASVIVVGVAYLIGSASFAVIVSAMSGLPDPRTYGSGNPGATNVLRSGRKAAAAITLAGDLLKGAVAVWLAKLATSHLGADAAAVPLAGLAAFLGHLYPVFFHFQGGKGVATAGGILFAFSMPVGLTAMVTWAAVFALTRISSVGALSAAIAAALAAWHFLGSGLDTMVILVMVVLLVWRHRGNIRKLLAGTEGKVV